MTAPEYLPTDVAAVWAEMVDRGADEGPELEAFCGQVARLRDAQKRLASEGLITAGPKGEPIPHPAIAIEKAAQAEIRTWGARFIKRRR